jgi:hypothetical protein
VLCVSIRFRISFDELILAFAVRLVEKEFPEPTERMACTPRAWIAADIEGNLTESDLRTLAAEHHRTANFVGQITEIISAADEPIPDSGGSGGSPRKDSIERRKARPWSTDEDNRSLLGIRKFGLGAAWSPIAEFVGSGRTRSQCSQRWIRGLDPWNLRIPWTAQEDQDLRRLVAIHGPTALVEIASAKGNRSAMQC